MGIDDLICPMCEKASLYPDLGAPGDRPQKACSYAYSRSCL